MHEAREAVTDPRALRTIMLSLQRMVKIGVYYPSGHSIFERAVDSFRQNIAKIAGDNPYIRFTIKNGHIYLQDIQLDTSLLFVQEFKETLAGLAIRCLDIDRDILSGEIQEFIKSLLAYRAKFNSTRAFTQINIEDLPPTVRITQVEYLSSLVQTGDCLDKVDPAQQTMEVFLESINKRGLTGRQLDQCRQLLEGVLRNPKLSSNDQKNLPFITWSDVESLVLSLTEQQDDKPAKVCTKSQQNINALASILRSLGERVTDEPSTAAIDLLISLVKRTPGEKVNFKELDSKKIAVDDRSNQLEVSEIKRFVEMNTTSCISEKYLEQHHRCEILTIVLRLLAHTLPLQSQYRLQQILREVLTGPIQDIEWDTIVSGVHSLLQREENGTLDVNLMMIISPLRRSAFSSSLCLLKQVCRKCKPTELNQLLPFIINELLVTDKQADQKVFQELCEIVLYLPAEDIKGTIPVLEKLDALSEQSISQNLFFSMHAKFYPIFAPLMESSGGMLLARRAFQAFVSNPNDWLIDAMLPVLDFSNTLHLKFLYEYLMIGALSEPTTKVKTLAGQIVVDKLPELSKDKRHELAIMRTILAMSRLKGPNIRQVLKNIATRRYLLVIPDWPLKCRKAAREALTTLNKVRPML